MLGHRGWSHVGAFDQTLQLGSIADSLAAKPGLARTAAAGARELRSQQRGRQREILRRDDQTERWTRLDRGADRESARAGESPERGAEQDGVATTRRRVR